MSAHPTPATHATGLALVCLAAALWGTVGVARGLMSAGAAVEPAAAGFARTALGAAFLLLAATARGGAFTLRGVPLGAVVGFGVAGAVFQLALFAAFAHVGVAVTSAVTVCAPPIIVSAATALVRGRAPHPGLVGALVVATLGAVVILRVDLGGAGSFDLVGAGLLAAASFAFAGVAVAARALSRSLPPFEAAGLGLAATATALGVVCVARGSLAVLPSLTPADLALLGYIGVVATGGAYLAFAAGLRRSASLGAGLAASMVEPAFGAIFATLLLHERLSPQETLGCLMILAAVILLFGAERRGAVPRPPGEAAPSA